MFADVEIAVTELLAILSENGRGVALPHLVGQRLAALDTVLGARENGDEIRAALTEFQAHEPLRVYLAHGHAKVTLDRNERWQVLFTIAAFRKGKLEHSNLLMDEADGTSIARGLGRDRQRLVGKLATLRSSLPLAGNVSADRPALRICRSLAS